MMLSKKLFTIGFIWILFFIPLGVHKAQAVNAGNWSPDQQVPGYLDDTFTPFLVADQNKTVHAFASQRVITGFRNLAIVYRKWTLSGGWTRPVDIILSPTGGDANIMGVFLDLSGTLHVIFTTTDTINGTSVYYSSAPASNADIATAWSSPMMVGENALGLNSGAIIGDSQGNLVIIYSGGRDGSGVYSVHSTDAGRTWSTIQPLFLTYNSELSTFSLRLAIGPERIIRAVWTVVTSLGGDEALYFANFDTQNSNWDTPIELTRKSVVSPDYFGPSFPAIVDNGSEIVVMYNNGNPYTNRPVGVGRPVQMVSISTNNGLIWNEPLAPFPFQLGRSGEHALVLDGQGSPHALFFQRIESTENGTYSEISGIWHSVFQDGVWSNPDRIVTLVPPHDVRAIVSQGNVLLVVWREDPGSGESGIWFSYSLLDMPELPIVPLPTVSSNTVLEKEPTEIPVVNSPIEVPETPIFDDAPPSNLGENPALPIIIGMIPVVLVLAGVIFGYKMFLKRRE